MTYQNHDGAIGVFDSGVGGLSVLRAIRNELPDERLIYLADSGHAPYGDRDADFILDRANRITEHFLASGVKAIVVACNTASVVAIEKIRSWCPVPVVAMEPAIKPASQSTRTGVVGVLATTRTLSSANVARLCEAYGKRVRILLRPCPGLVEQVEHGELYSAATRRLLTGYLSPLLTAGADTIVLGCTHYPFLGELIGEIAGTDVAIVDSGAAVAKQVLRRLEGSRVSTCNVPALEPTFFSSAEPDQARSVISTLWGKSVEVHSLALTHQG
ncbi:MAG: glutamate racemase [Methylomonas sp.]|nr:glutamate racemase [Methylomonas sp.]